MKTTPIGFAAIGEEIGIYYDAETAPQVGEYLRTSTGRTYLVVHTRTVQRGEHAGTRHRLRCVVVEPDHPAPGDVVLPLVWYARRKGGDQPRRIGP